MIGVFPSWRGAADLDYQSKKHKMGRELFLEEQGLKLKEGTILDASIIAAPSSRKNRRGEGDAQMKQSSKGKQWHFAMKLHIGVDSNRPGA